MWSQRLSWSLSDMFYMWLSFDVCTVYRIYTFFIMGLLSKCFSSYGIFLLGSFLVLHGSVFSSHFIFHVNFFFHVSSVVQIEGLMIYHYMKIDSISCEYMMHYRTIAQISIWKQHCQNTTSHYSFWVEKLTTNHLIWILLQCFSILMYLLIDTRFLSNESQSNA